MDNQLILSNRKFMILYIKGVVKSGRITNVFTDEWAYPNDANDLTRILTFRSEDEKISWVLMYL